jgi:hypothetical protein
MTKQDPRALYAAERERQLAAQRRRKPADPQRTAGRAGADPRAVVALLMVPCSTDVAPWQPCGHPELNHVEPDPGRVTYCSIATGAGRCRCNKHTRPHDYGPDDRELSCRRCGLYLLDIAGPCEPRP